MVDDGRRLNRRKVIYGAGAAAALGATTMTVGCGGDDDVPAGAATTTSASAAAQPSTAPASPATKNIPAEFVIANEAEPDDLLPYFAGFGPGMVMRSIYESLLEVRMILKPDGSVDVQYVPVLATSFEQTGPTVFRFKLRDGATFHDGEAWDAAAAKASFDALHNPDTAKMLKKSALLSSGGLKEMRVVDPMTVEIATAAPTNINEVGIYVRLGFSGVSPKLLKDKGLPGMLETAAGTGPFVFKSWTRGGDLKLERNAKHWNKSGTNIPALRFITRKEASVRAQTIKSGEAHLAFNIGAEQGSSLPRQLVAGGFQSSSLRINNAIAPTNDKRLRQAVNYAIDREGINKSIFKGTAQPIGFFAFQPVKLDPFAYKPDQAAKLISEAGVKGKELELVYGEGRIPEEDQLAEIYKSELEAVGLKIKLTKLEPRQYNELGGKPFPAQPPLYMETTSSGNYGEVAGGLRDKYGCKGSGTFCSPAFDDEFAKLAALTGVERQALLQSIASRLHTDETPRAWVIGVRQVHGVAGNVGSNLPLNAYLLTSDLFFA